MDDMDDDQVQKKTKRYWEVLHMLYARWAEDPTPHGSSQHLVCWLHTGSAPAPAPPSVLIKIHQHKQSQRPTIFYPQQNLKTGVRTTPPWPPLPWPPPPPMLATEPALDIGDGGDGPERRRRVLVSSLLDESHRFCIFLSIFIYYLFVLQACRCRESTAIGRPPSTPRIFLWWYKMIDYLLFFHSLHSDHPCGQGRRSVCPGAHLSSQVH